MCILVNMHGRKRLTMGGVLKLASTHPFSAFDNPSLLHLTGQGVAMIIGKHKSHHFIILSRPKYSTLKINRRIFHFLYQVLSLHDSLIPLSVPFSWLSRNVCLQDECPGFSPYGAIFFVVKANEPIQSNAEIVAKIAENRIDRSSSPHPNGCGEHKSELCISK